MHLGDTPGPPAGNPGSLHPPERPSLYWAYDHQPGVKDIVWRRLLDQRALGAGRLGAAARVVLHRLPQRPGQCLEQRLRLVV